jgi:hypothetical protein
LHQSLFLVAGYSARGRQVASTTYNQRLAVLSSCYGYAKKQVLGSPLYLAQNPIERRDRAKVQEYAGAQPLSGDVVAHTFAHIMEQNVIGVRCSAFLEFSQEAFFSHSNRHLMRKAVDFQHATPNSVATNATWPTTSAFAAPCSCPFLTMFLTSNPPDFCNTTRNYPGWQSRYR